MKIKSGELFPKYIDVESWYPYPQYLTPETKDNSFTNVLQDVGNYFSCVSDDNEPCMVTGLEDLPGHVMSPFPNPTSGMVYLGKKKGYKIYSMMRKLIDVGLGKQANLSSGPPGIYILQIKNQNKRIIVSH